jgi:hypothetical protein
VRVSIEVDEPVHTGERFRVAVVVQTPSARKSRGVSLLLRGFTNLTTNPMRKDPLGSFGSFGLVLTEGEQLEPGARRFEGSLSLPEDAPPTGEGVMEVYYQLDARVMLELPWVFDATASRRLAVARPPRRERPPPRPATMSSAARAKNAVFVELSLDDTTFAPGESITGAFSVGNVGGRRVDAATVSLVPRRPEVVGGGEVSVFKSLVGVGEGSAVRFAIPLPRTAALSFPTQALEIDQAVVLRVDGAWSACRIPVLIDNFAPLAGARPSSPSPLVGSTRWRFAWQDEGSRAGLALEGRDLALHGTLAGVVHAQVHPQGNGVRARLAWESLGIGLSVGPRRLLPGGIAFDEVDRAFAGRFTARGREPAQVLAALGPDLREALLAFDEADLDDTGARVASSGSARDPGELRRFLTALETLAEAVVATERRLPPPSWATNAVEAAWRAFAATTTGRLHAGRMAVTGAFADGDHFDVETRHDAHGRAHATRVTLVIDPAADRTSVLPEGADADLIRSVRGRGLAPVVTIGTHAIVLELDSVIPDPAVLATPMAEMARLARRLRGEARRGPYR